LPILLRDAREAVEFGHRFDVELEDAAREAEAHLVLGLADAGEHDAVGGTPASIAFISSPPETTSAPAAEGRQRGDDAEIRVGLDRVGDQQVTAGERFGQDLVVAAQRCVRIT